MPAQPGRPRPVRTPISPRAAAIYGRTDLADAWSVRLRPGMPTDPQVWADAIFRQEPPRWVVALFRLRDRLVRLVGIPPASRDTFATRAVHQDEVVIGTDDVHLDFRATVRVGDGRVVASTVARATNRRGRLYLVVIRLFHPVIVKAMLARAASRLG